MTQSVLIISDTNEISWRLWQVANFGLVVLILGVLKMQ